MHHVGTPTRAAKLHKREHLGRSCDGERTLLLCPQRNGEIFCGARPKVCGKQRSGELPELDGGARASRARVLWGVSVWRKDAAITKTE